jgi:hypothetical protein
MRRFIDSILLPKLEVHFSNLAIISSGFKEKDISVFLKGTQLFI